MKSHIGSFQHKRKLQENNKYPTKLPDFVVSFTVYSRDSITCIWYFELTVLNSLHWLCVDSNQTIIRRIDSIKSHIGCFQYSRNGPRKQQIIQKLFLNLRSTVSNSFLLWMIQENPFQIFTETVHCATISWHCITLPDFQ